MGWTIIILMSLSVFGYIGGTYFDSLSQNSFNVEYNGFTFVPQGDGYLSTISGVQYFFVKPPTEVENITVPFNVVSLRTVPRVFMNYPTSAQDNVSATFDFMSRVFLLNNVASQEVCLQEEGCGDLPILDCTIHDAVIFQIGLVSEYRVDGRCLYIQGSDVLELQTLSERVAYTFLGVLS